ncbi:hypothetical protein ENUP19_0082G0060 [Entamoeba nuttalli]|uniref:Yip1 domain containing protein n=2 Tax=Entamoeba nuttalli TaxID=412467 RepID=K2H256_ENTNP|nr:Yip1 domain containing protein [Entamoeba nuttalli P19]EKE40377.1 Yip1 domain containing protein [Entamoeba nuttalli P19]|eukprot:XP_008857290.1 Yip1 domain containing protein [Entamoeba nuttalli P19]
MTSENTNFELEISDDGNDADEFLQKASQIASETAFLEDDGFIQNPIQNSESTLTSNSTTNGSQSETEKEQKNTTPQSTDLENEPPLLEELGIDLNKIGKKMVQSLNPFSTPDVSESDVIGSIIISFALGIVILLNGKLRFGNIYGFSIIASFVEYLVMNLLSNKNMNYLLIFTHFAYNLFPMIFFGLILFVLNSFKAANLTILITSFVFVVISTYTCSKTINSLMELPEKILLTIYPISLYYGLFILFVIF